MPAGVPVACVGIGQARNAGLLAARILGVVEPRLWPDMDAYRAGLRTAAQDKGARLREDAGY
jgi:5-(carboxyamino)imidazole ribonucleotide mutase